MAFFAVKRGAVRVGVALVVAASGVAIASAAPRLGVESRLLPVEIATAVTEPESGVLTAPPDLAASFVSIPHVDGVAALLAALGTPDSATADAGAAEPVEAMSGIFALDRSPSLIERAASFGWGSATESISIYDWADPDVLFRDGTFYTYATNTLWSNVPYMIAEPGGELIWAGDAFPDMPSWVTPGWTWAPSVTEMNGHFVLHYTARHTASDKQCIGVATAENPPGPFVDNNGGPFVCALDQGGAIDASVVEDDGVSYLLWKTDGNCCGWLTIIYSQELTADGTAFAADPIELIRNDQSWEYDVVEAPSMVENGGIWHLFYGAHRWDTEHYATGYARCSSPVGPCVKEDSPLLASEYAAAGTLAGPCAMEVIDLPDSNQDLVVYHGWTDGRVGYHHNHRSSFIQYIDWVNGYPVLTTTPGLTPLAGDDSALAEVHTFG